MANIGIKISQDDQNVISASDKNLVLTSKLNSLKIVNSGKVTHDQASNPETLAISHGLDYIPGHLFFVKNPEETNRWYGAAGESPTNSYRWWDLGSSNANLNVHLAAPIGSDWEVKYYFFADEGSATEGTDSLTPEDFGIKASQPGINVLSAKDSQFVFNSRMEAIKIVDIVDQSIVYSTSPARAEVEINHGLNFTPAFVGFVEMPFATAVDPPFGTKYYSIPFMQVGNTEVGCYVTSTKLGFFIENIANATFNFHVAILGNEIE